VNYLMRLREVRLWGEMRALVCLAVPLVLGNIAWTAMATIELLLIGRLGAQALAAAALGLSLYSFCLVAGTGLVLAAAPIIAEARERPDSAQPSRFLVQTLWLAFLVCLPAWILLSHAETVLRWLGEPSSLALDAQEFLRGLQWALLPQLAFLTLRNALAALEQPRLALVASIAVLPVSFFGGLLLIFGAGPVPPLGLFGAGVASTIASGTMFATLLFAIRDDRRLTPYRLFETPWTPNPQLLNRLFRLGGPISVTLVVEIGIFNFAALLIGRIAPDWLAAHAVVAQIVSLLFMVPMGLAQAASVRVGLSVGRDDAAGVSATGRAALMVAFTYAIATALLVLILRDGLAALFISGGGPDDVSSRRATSMLLLIVGAMQFADNLQGTLIGLLRGLQDSFVPMLLAVVGFWVVGLGGATLLGSVLRLGAPGVWLGLFAGLTTTAVFYGARWRRLCARRARGVR